jgi:co-chaperonin GroES (HSP10)
MKPLNNLVLVKVLTETQEQGGLIILRRDANFDKAEVLAVAANDDVKVGDTVLLVANKGLDTPNGRLVNKGDILAVIE